MRITNSSRLSIPAITVALLAGLLTAGSAYGVTVATFDDPAADGSTPLFTVDLNADTVSGGWTDAQTNLDLEVVITGLPVVYEDAFFTLTDVFYGNGLFGGDTGGGTIKFFADNTADPCSATPLIQIDFESAYVRPDGFGGLDLFRADGVVISGSEITVPLTQESFAFSFANQVELPAGGYTATAAFTSSATIVPEPATLILLGLGSAFLVRPRRKA